MSLLKHKPSILKILRESIMMIIGAILIWRGIWVLLDLLDVYLFGGNHLWSAIAGIMVGVIIIFLADRDLEDII